ncbi:sensor histidine kinase [Aeromicrobium wangtongii]|uniref:histidine kinase n=1 Tax=Aeromicrobium wangtongii TaxID=2969247 RepID=A0ABY5MCP6_9ACTN|nr:sensor histidine kinase [Aeromicrobium wangtongii]MCD9197487.1 sensor histidine kinase [Aeromicrobium wangtongii]UUP14979.1 sensor histidine kinase [Aeromicrobium wangtongii]
MLDLDRRWTRPKPTSEQVRRDVLGGVAAAILSVASVEVWHSAYGSTLGWKGIEAYVLFGLAGLLLALRRRFPLTTLLLVSAVFLAIIDRLPELGAIFTIQVIMFAALYSAWAWSRARHQLYATSGAVLVAVFGWLVWEYVTADMPARPREGILPPYAAAIVYSIAINTIYLLGAMAWGHVAWRSARQREEIAEGVAAERRAQDRERDIAVQAERVRIARDLHDVVAHHISGIGVQAAGAARILDNRPDMAKDAIEVIERSSRQAVLQMHQLVGLLRSDHDGEARAPQPGLDELHTLATAVGGRPAAASTTVTFRQVGEPFEVPPTVGLSLFRIAQEAVANIRRHARATSGEVVVRFAPAGDQTPASVEVEVIDDGKGGDLDASPAPSGSGGFGLTGIRERAAMHGGTWEIGPRPEGGFRVRVRIPVAA